MYARTQTTSADALLCRRGGFTLLELLVAVSLMAILGAAVMASFSGGLRVWERSDEYGRSEQTALFLMERLGRDIANAVVVGENGFEGYRDRLTLLTQSDAYAGPSPGPLESVSYDVLRTERGGLVRRASPWPVARGAVFEERLSEGHVELELAYASTLGRDGPGGWVGLWRSETNLPHAVKVSVVDRTGEALERVFLPGGMREPASSDGEGAGR